MFDLSRRLRDELVELQVQRALDAEDATSVASSHSQQVASALAKLTAFACYEAFGAFAFLRIKAL